MVGTVHYKAGSSSRKHVQLSHFYLGGRGRSSRQQIDIREIKDGVLVLPNHRYRTPCIAGNLRE